MSQANELPAIILDCIDAYLTSEEAKQRGVTTRDQFVSTILEDWLSRYNNQDERQRALKQLELYLNDFFRKNKGYG